MFGFGLHSKHTSLFILITYISTAAVRFSHPKSSKYYSCYRATAYLIAARENTICISCCTLYTVRQDRSTISFMTINCTFP